MPIETKGINIKNNNYKEIFLRSIKDWNKINNNPKLLINDYYKLKNYINNFLQNPPNNINVKNIEYRIPWEYGPPILF